MFLRFLPLALVLPGVLLAETRATHGLRVPDGFEVTEFADGKLAPDIHCLTVGPDGQVVVSGRGYLRVLVEGADGKAGRAADFADPPKDGAHGLFWEKGDLYCVGDGGLRVYREAGGAGQGRPSKLLFECKTGGEHAAHAVVRGPDGWLYLLAGDGAGITAKAATRATSPIKDPVAGCVVRFSPDFSGSEVVADGFRNAYGMDWNADGELFTFDSDNERCVSLPWYEPTRLYHVPSGGRHGWLTPRTAFWREPPYFLDVVRPVATLGRGSPTGVVCYRHTQFPARYRGGMFLLDWTFGKVFHVPLTKRGSSYEGKPEVFLESVGDNGFAPTAAAVHPKTGDLFVSIGGRGTRGAVYRIRHLEGYKTQSGPTRLPSRSLDPKALDGADLAADAGGDKADPHARRHALEMLLRHRDKLPVETLEAAVVGAAASPDRGIRQATARLLAALPPADQKRVAARLTTPNQRAVALLANPSFEAATLIEDEATRLEGVRLVQLALGDIGSPSAKNTVFEGYSRRATRPAVPPGLTKTLIGAMAKSAGDAHRELARTLAMLEADEPAALEAVVAVLAEKRSPVDDIHYLIVLARLTAKRPAEVTALTAERLLGLDKKAAALGLHRDTNWPLRVAELHAALAKRDPKLNAAMLASPDFGRPDHVLFCRAPVFDRKAAAKRFLVRAEADASFAWNAELVALVAQADPESALPRLRKLWGEAGLDEAILPILAKHPDIDDRERYVTGLGSARSALVADSLSALEKLPPPPAASDRHRDEAFALVRAVRQLGPAKEDAALRGSLLARLGRLAGSRVADLPAALAWLRKAHPELAKRLGDADGVDVAGWAKRLAAIDWPAGDAKRGSAVYTKASCATCHSGVAALGPDLRGVSARFSRDDLFTAILQPSKDVSPRYRTTQLVTARGKVYQGIIVYEAVDGVLMLTGPGEALRITKPKISERRLTARSLMPSGLLDKLDDGDIADLYAYLKGLK